MQLLPWASAIPWDPSWLLGRAPGMEASPDPTWGHVDGQGPWHGGASWPALGLLVPLSGTHFPPAYKNGWFRPRNLEMSSHCLHHPAQEDQWRCWWRCDDGHADGVVTTARPCADCSMNMFSPSGHKNPTESELLSVFQGRKWRQERLIFVFKVTQLVRKWAGIGTQSFLTPEPMLFTDLLCCQGGREGRSPDSVQGWWRVGQPVRRHGVCVT